MIKKLCIHFLTVTVFASTPLTVQTRYFSQSIKSVSEIDRLVRLCFTESNRLVTLIGNVSQKLTEKVHKSELVAIIRISNDVPSVDMFYTIAKESLTMYIDEYYFRFQYKAQGFVLAVNSQPVLHQQLRELLNSRWWSAGGLFIIVDDGNAMNNSCANAYSFLKLTWQYNILSSVFLCHDEIGKSTMYSYNPYNDMIPKNWLKVAKYSTRRGRPWILLKRSDGSEVPESCNDVFFDKTKTVDNYKIRTNSVFLPPRLWIDYNKTGIERYFGVEGEAMKCIFRFLNASIEDIPYRGKDLLGYSYKNGTYVGMLSDVVAGRVDIGLNARYVVNTWKLGMSYPHGSSAFCFLVKFQGNVPQWMNLAFVFDLWMNLGLITVILLTTVVLSYQTTFAAGSLNGLRLLISTALLKLPTQTPIRLFLAGVFSLWLIANGVFQGKVISLLTKPRAYPNPETQEELGKAGHKIMGYPPFAIYIEDPILLSHYSPDFAVYNESKILTEHIAYIVDCQVINTYFKNISELHILRERLQVLYMSFMTVLDWPLLGRFNQLMQRLVEAGLLDFWETRRARIIVVRAIGSSESFRSPSLSLIDLAFVFDWLVFGLFLSTLVFFYEIFITRCRIRFTKNCQVY